MQEVIFIEDKPLLDMNKSIDIVPSASQIYTISEPKSDAKSVRLDIFFTSAVQSRYKPKLLAKVKVVYRYDEKEQVERYYVMLNRDEEVSDTLVKATSTLTLKGYDIKSIDIEVENRGTEVLHIEKLLLYESRDLSPRQIATVLKEQTIQADIVQATSTFSDTMFTQLLQTAVLSMTTQNAQPGQIVNYIKIEDWTMGFYTAELGEEVEQFSIRTKVAGQEREILYWYAVIEGEDAYKHITTIDPRAKYPDIREDERGMFKLMVYKPRTLAKKMGIEFVRDSEGNFTPQLVYGAGTSTEQGSRLGKGFTYKDSKGFYHEYVKQDGSGTVGVVMDDSGVYLKGVVNELEYLEAYDDGFIWKYKSDPQVKAKVVEESNEFKGLEIDGIFKPFRRVAGSVDNV